MEVYLINTPQGLIPSLDGDREKLKKIEYFVPIKATIRLPRNLGFHRKFFAMIDAAFHIWNPEETESEYGAVIKDKDNFYKELLVLAGFYKPVFRLDGSFTLEHESISFSKMSQERFEEVYKRVYETILNKVAINYTGTDLDNFISHMEQFGYEY